jgi:hypothetical protein
VLSAVLALAFACRLDKLLETPRPPGLGVAPDRVAETAPEGAEERLGAIRVSSPRGQINWTAHPDSRVTWLGLDNPSGSTPDSLVYRIFPNGLSPGTYRETIVIVPDDTTATPTVRVPVELRINPVSPTTGDLTVRVATSGDTPDPNGYSVTVDGAQSRTLAINDSTTYTGLTAGSHVVQIGDVASDCTVSGGTSQAATVTAGQRATLTFAVTCSATPPETGDLTVSASTTGGTPDPNGYIVTVNGGQSHAITINGSTTYTSLVVGSYTVQLGDMASNCTVSGGSSHTVNVTANQTTTESFAVNCPSPPATRLLFSVHPTTTTAGATITPAIQVRAVDGAGNTITTFTGNVRLDIRDNPGAGTLAGNANASAVSGVASFPGLSINKSGSSYTLAAHASGLADGVSDPFAINPGAPDHLVFTVQPTNTQANRPIAPAVQVTMLDINGNVATSFTDIVFMGIDHDGALVPPATLSAPGTQRAAAAGVATFEDLRIDKVGVGYTLVASATGHKGGFSGSFDVNPAPPSTGDLTVGASTSGGTPDPDGYTVTVDGGQARGIGINGATTYAGIAASAHTVELIGLAANCSISGQNPRSVNVPAGSSASTTFTVDCPTPPPPTGALTVGATTTGGTPDPNGYTVTLDGGQLRTIGNNGSTPYTGLAPGTHVVVLGDIASNCTVSGGASHTVTVVAGLTTTETYAVDCPAPPPPPATHLDFTTQPPGIIVLSTTFSVTVTALNAQGGVATGFTGPVQLTLQGPIAIGGLTGTTQVNTVNGVAQFTNLRVTGLCVGCSLVANASGLTGATSSTFNVVLGQ